MRLPGIETARFGFKEEGGGGLESENFVRNGQVGKRDGVLCASIVVVVVCHTYPCSNLHVEAFS